MSGFSYSFPLAVSLGGTGDTGTAYTTYTPTITAGSGTFTTTSASGRYKTLGKTVFYELAITVTTIGTAGTNIQATLPVGHTLAANVGLCGRESGVTGFMCSVVAADKVYITKYDGTFLGANGYVFAVSGIYEIT